MNTQRLASHLSITGLLLLCIIGLASWYRPVESSLVAGLGIATLIVSLYAFEQRYAAGVKGIRDDLHRILEATRSMPGAAKRTTEEEALQNIPCPRCHHTPRYVGDTTVQCTKCDHIELRPKTPTLEAATT